MKIKIGIICLVILASCAIRPIPNNWPTIVTELSENELGNGKVIIFNNAGILQTMDRTDGINIVINDVSSGQLKSKTYRIVELPIEKVKFYTEHRDVVLFKFENTLEITPETKYIRIEPDKLSHKVEIVSKLPDNFTKFKKMK